MNKLNKIEKYVNKRKEAPLLKLAHDKEQDIRLAAIDGLGKIGKDDSFNYLITALADKEPVIRAASAKALGVMKNEHASAHLSYRLQHETDETVIQAIKGALNLLHEL